MYQVGVGIAQSAKRRAIEVQLLAEAKDFSLLRGVQTGSGSHLASHTMRIGGPFPGVKRPGLEADHSPPSSSDVKNGGAILPLPHTSSWCGGVQ
jgi:hypothetical protein